VLQFKPRTWGSAWVLSILLGEKPDLHPYGSDKIPGFSPAGLVEKPDQSRDLKWGLYRLYVDALLGLR